MWLWRRRGPPPGRGRADQACRRWASCGPGAAGRGCTGLSPVALRRESDSKARPPLTDGLYREFGAVNAAFHTRLTPSPPPPTPAALSI